MTTSLQFETAFKIFVDLYGIPKWESNPKEGQNRDEIVAQWVNELKGYTVEQVANAAYNIFRYKRSTTFPTISHLLVELSTKEKENNVFADENKEANRVYVQLLGQKTRLKSEILNKLSAQRTVYRLYGVEVDGYRNKDDNGYDNGQVPTYLMGAVV